MEIRPDLAPAVNGKLNPAFVGWLMGFPEGWVDLPGELHGAHRVDKLRALGNSVVPVTAELAFMELFERIK